MDYYLRFRHQRLETYRKTCEKYVFANLLCHVTYGTAFNKCSYLVFAPADLNSLLYEQDNPKYVRYPAAANVFIFFFK